MRGGGTTRRRGTPGARWRGSPGARCRVGRTARTGRRTSRGLRRAVRRSPRRSRRWGRGTPLHPGSAGRGGGHRGRKPRVGEVAQVPGGLGPAGLDDLCRAGAVRRVLGQAALDQGAQRPGTAGQVRRLVQHAVHQRGHVPFTEGRPAAHGEGRHRAEREDVDGGRDGQATNLLRRHELGGPHGHAALGQVRGLRGPCDPEIDHARPVRGQQHVGRFEITVDDTGGVDRLQSLGDPGHQQDDRLRRHRPVLRDGLLQRRPRHVRRHQPRRCGRGIGAEKFRGVQPAHPLGGLDLLAETRPEVRVVAQFRPDDLQRDAPPARRGRQVHPPHAPGPEPGTKAETADLGGIVTGQRLHSRSARPSPTASPTRSASSADRPRRQAQSAAVAWSPTTVTHTIPWLTRSGAQKCVSPHVPGLARRAGRPPGTAP